ncbi:MAG TPA: spore germination protein GerW family protein, partial [Thermohalobaculum sp.]|nr:spore germination protein GerW family protein [Thermohalobaculum sp.]
KMGGGGGTGAGGGIKPVGAIIIDQSGARVESVRGMMANLVEAIGEAATKAMERKGCKCKEPE